MRMESVLTQILPIPVIPIFFLFMSQTFHIIQTCSVLKTEQFWVDNSSTIGQLVLHIPLMEMELGNEVRINLV